MRLKIEQSLIFSGAPLGGDPDYEGGRQSGIRTHGSTEAPDALGKPYKIKPHLLQFT